MPNENAFIDDDEQYQESNEQDQQNTDEKSEDAAAIEQDHPEQDDETAQRETEDQQVHPLDQRFNELGLQNQFQGGLQDAIERLPHMNRWQTQVAQENAALRAERERLQRELEQRQQGQTSGYDPEKFYNDPFPVLDDRYITKEEAQRLQQQVQRAEQMVTQTQIDRFRETHKDMDQLFPVMQTLYQQEPGVAGLNNPLEYLYDKAKRLTAPHNQQVVNQAQQKINDQIEQDSKRASTEGSGRKAPSAKPRRPSLDDLYNMPLDKLGQYIGYGPEE